MLLLVSISYQSTQFYPMCRSVEPPPESRELSITTKIPLVTLYNHTYTFPPSVLLVPDP